jgi:hypothetical protein
MLLRAAGGEGTRLPATSCRAAAQAAPLSINGSHYLPPKSPGPDVSPRPLPSHCQASGGAAASEYVLSHNEPIETSYMCASGLTYLLVGLYRQVQRGHVRGGGGVQGGAARGLPAGDAGCEHSHDQWCVERKESSGVPTPC